MVGEGVMATQLSYEPQVGAGVGGDVQTPLPAEPDDERLQMKYVCDEPVAVAASAFSTLAWAAPDAEL